jgi:hypothetical protein
MSSTREIAEAMERSTSVAGIYGSQRFLHVLVRLVLSDSGEKTWTLIRIDPQRDLIVGETVLPISAPHILVIPGPQYWAFVEKGRVRAFGEQEADSLLLVPSAWIVTASEFING